MKLDKGKEKQKENKKDKSIDEEDKGISSEEEDQTPPTKGTPRPVPLKKKKTGASQMARKNYALRVKHVAPKRKKLKKYLPEKVDVQILDSSSKYVAAQTTVEQSPPHASHEEEEDREPSISSPQEEPLNEDILIPTKGGEPVRTYGGEKNKEDARGQQNEEPTPPPTNQEAKHQHREEPVASNPPPDNTSVDVPLGESNKDHSKINKESEVQVYPHLEKQTEVVVPDPTSQVNITSNPSETTLSSSGKSQMPSNLKECLEVLDENPFAVLDLLTSEGSMPYAHSDSQSYQPSNKNVHDHLESLRNLVFEYSFLELLPRDVEYQYRIQKEFETLLAFQNDLTPNQIKGLDSLKTLFDQAMEILREHQENSQKASNVRVEKDEMLEKLKDSRNKMSNFNESLGTLSHQIAEVADKKKVIKERMKKLREEEEQLLKDEENYKASMTRLETRKLELLTAIKYVSSELVKASKNLQNLEAKDASLLRQYDGLKHAYQPLREWPPFLRQQFLIM